MFSMFPVKLKLAFVTEELALDGLVMVTSGARHSSYLMVLVLLSVPQALIAFNTISLFPLASERLAVTVPFVKLKLEIFTPLTVKLVC